VQDAPDAGPDDTYPVGAGPRWDAQEGGTVVTSLGPGGTAVQERDVEATRRDTRRDQLALLTQLRAVDHWRRLVSARLDLAVAAVAPPDEPAAAPGLSDLLGLPVPGTAKSEAALLLRLRAAQRELDAHAVALRSSSRLVTADVVTRLDVAPPAGAPGRPTQADGDDTVARVVPLRRRAGRSASGGRTPRRVPDDVA
jgi:hypothetical protein